MNAPPQDPDDQTHRPATKVVAYLGFPTDTIGPDFETEEWRVLRVEQGLGAQHRAVLARDLGQAGQRIENRKLSPTETDLVEIWSLDDDGQRLYSLFRGKLLVNRIGLAPGAEHELAEVILPLPWFGDLCEGQRVYERANLTELVVHVDLEFNPLVDGRIIANHHVRKDSRPSPGIYWVDPESVRTPAAQEQHNLIPDQDVRLWNVAEAAHALQTFLNADETHLRNFPAVDTSEDNPPVPDAAFGESPQLEDEILPRGHYLPAYLDALLPKYGYQWTVDFKPDDEDPDIIKPQIRMYKRGIGITRTIPYQAIGETLHAASTQPLALEITTDLSRLANIVVGHGSLEEREVTIELQRGWPDPQDSTSLTALKKTTEGYDLDNDNIWRKWVGNEAGDYNGTRPEITAALDLSTVFEPDPDTFERRYVPKRRPVSDCLTWRAKTETEAVRHPPILEYSTDEGTTWKRAGQDWRPLTHEFGVYLTDSNANGLVRTLQGAGSKAKLRLTGTIRGDRRITHEVDKTADTASNIETRLFLDLSHRFHDRQRATSGPHASVLTGACDEEWHFLELEEFIDQVANNEKAAVVEFQVPLHGLHFDYEIGDVIEEIDGRKISLNRLAYTADEVRGVQIVGRIWDIQQQQTILLVAPFDSYVSFGVPLGRTA